MFSTPCKIIKLQFTLLSRKSEISHELKLMILHVEAITKTINYGNLLFRLPRLQVIFREKNFHLDHDSNLTDDTSASAEV